MNTQRWLSRAPRGSRSVALLVCALLVAGCGGTGGSGAKPAAQTGGGASASGSSGGAAGQVSLAQLYAKAKGETVVFASPAPLKFFQPVLNLFKKTYPGVTVRYEAQGNQNIAANIPTQEAAGSVQIDVAALTSDFVPGVVKWMTPVSWPKGTTPDPFVPGGVALHWFDSPWVLAYNTKRVTPQQLPHTWQDLLKPQWSGGRIVVNAPPSWADALLLSPSWGAQKALAFGKQLAAQKPLIETRPILGLQAIVSGQADLGFTLGFLVLKAKAQGQPVDVAPLSPQTADPDFLFIPKGAPHPIGAELLASWLVSAPARQAFEKASYFGVAAPCSASSQAKYLCSKGVKVLYFKTYQARVKAGSFEKSFAAELGIKS